MHACPGRVNDDHLRLNFEKGQVLTDVSEDELAVFDPVLLTIPRASRTALSAISIPITLLEELARKMGIVPVPL